MKTFDWVEAGREPRPRPDPEPDLPPDEPDPEPVEDPEEWPNDIPPLPNPDETNPPIHVSGS